MAQPHVRKRRTAGESPDQGFEHLGATHRAGRAYRPADEGEYADANPDPRRLHRLAAERPPQAAHDGPDNERRDQYRGKEFRVHAVSQRDRAAPELHTIAAHQYVALLVDPQP